MLAANQVSPCWASQDFCLAKSLSALKATPLFGRQSRLPCAPSKKMGVAKTRRKRLRQVRPAFPSFNWVLGCTEGLWLRAICEFWGFKVAPQRSGSHAPAWESIHSHIGKWKRHKSPPSKKLLQLCCHPEKSSKHLKKPKNTRNHPEARVESPLRRRAPDTKMDQWRELFEAFFAEFSRRPFFIGRAGKSALPTKRWGGLWIVKAFGQAKALTRHQGET